MIDPNSHLKPGNAPSEFFFTTISPPPVFSRLQAHLPPDWMLHLGATSKAGQVMLRTILLEMAKHLHDTFSLPTPPPTLDASPIALIGEIGYLTLPAIFHSSSTEQMASVLTFASNLPKRVTNQIAAARVIAFLTHHKGVVPSHHSEYVTAALELVDPSLLATLIAKDQISCHTPIAHALGLAGREAKLKEHYHPNPNSPLPDDSIMRGFIMARVVNQPNTYFAPRDATKQDGIGSLFKRMGELLVGPGKREPCQKTECIAEVYTRQKREAHMCQLASEHHFGHALLVKYYAHHNEQNKVLHHWREGVGEMSHCLNVLENLVKQECLSRPTNSRPYYREFEDLTNMRVPFHLQILYFAKQIDQAVNWIICAVEVSQPTVPLEIYSAIMDVFEHHAATNTIESATVALDFHLRFARRQTPKEQQDLILCFSRLGIMRVHPSPATFCQEILNKEILRGDVNFNTMVLKELCKAGCADQVATYLLKNPLHIHIFEVISTLYEELILQGHANRADKLHPCFLGADMETIREIALLRILKKRCPA
ncbi:MAG: hypothetical protein S4CHLAM102_08760 [Chlamydiia bacterium]|nr:hypothetical protein [Chlamydiia bacterium]